MRYPSSKEFTGPEAIRLNAVICDGYAPAGKLRGFSVSSRHASCWNQTVASKLGLPELAIELPQQEIRCSGNY